MGHCKHLFVELPISSSSEVSNQVLHPMVTHHKLRTDQSLAYQMMLMTVSTPSQLVEPKTLCSALKDETWVAALHEEHNALTTNCIWQLVPHPPNKNIVGSKWVYRMKYKDNGSLDHFKARLVAKGFSQVSRIDYDETFSLVVKPKTIRLIISLDLSIMVPMSVRH